MRVRVSMYYVGMGPTAGSVGGLDLMGEKGQRGLEVVYG